MEARSHKQPPEKITHHPAFVGYLLDGYMIYAVQSIEPSEGFSAKRRFWKVRLMLKQKDGTMDTKRFIAIEEDGKIEVVRGG